MDNAPRPLPPRPRSVPRPRPRPPSDATRPPLEARWATVVSPSVVVKVSLTFDLDRSFLLFVSAQGVIVPTLHVRNYTRLNSAYIKLRYSANNSVSSLKSLTVCDALDCSFQIAISLLEGRDSVLICPIWEHFLNCADFAAILLLQLSNFAVIFN